MDLSIVGAGYVGLVAAACFAEKGRTVICIDENNDKVKEINRGKSPIFEVGLEELISKNVAKGILRASTDINEIVDTYVTFVAVGTPSKKDGSIDLTYMEKAVEDIAKAIKDKKNFHVIVIKSTVVPGTTEHLSKIFQKTSQKDNSSYAFAMNPEFLKEGVAVNDFLNPDRIIIGTDNNQAAKILREIYAPFYRPIVQMSSSAVAEMVKYTSNTLLATKISFANEISAICKEAGIDVFEVMYGVGLDKRLGRDFLNAGPGFGGSCFPKDLRALIDYARSRKIAPVLLQSVLDVNRKQSDRIIKLATKIGLPDNVAVLGLAFKPGTDDTRETPAYPIIEELLKQKAIKKIILYDPKAMVNAEIDLKAKCLPRYDIIGYAKSLDDAVRDAEMIIIITDWNEFRNTDLYKNKIVIDTRHIIRDINNIDILIDTSNITISSAIISKLAKQGTTYEGL
jgi:UDPglucose 6-dehydrogenase